MSRRARGQPLFQTKEDTNFKEALKLYEAKHHKKALKLIDTNLKKKSHAPSLALKGLLLYNIHSANGKNEDPQHVEAKLYFRKALKEDESNPIINHIIAIFSRAICDYAEAAKYYRLALDNGSENKNILKDLSVTEAQLRRYKAMATSRGEILDEFPGYRAHWTGLAVAHHLNETYNLAEKTLTRFEDLAEGKLSEPEFFEHSECLLYKNRIIFESGDVKRALENLQKIEPNVLDKLSVYESRALYQSMLGDHKAASLTYRKLLQRNPDKVDYYYLLEASLGIASSETNKRLRLYNKLEKFYPRSDPPKIIPLVFLPSASREFESKLNAYLTSKLSRGVPSVFNALSFVYKNPEKAKVLERLVFEYLKEITSDKVADPTVVVWTLYFISQHYLALHDLAKAEEYVDKAISHSPTLVELYLLKGKITKHKGEFQKASEIVNSARLLDLQDRFINCKTVKYYLRSNDVDNAIKVASLFTKNDNAVNGLKDLHLMQANWYLIEEADSYFRLFQEAKNTLLKRLTILDAEDAEIPPETLKEIKEDIDLVNKFKGLALKRFNAVVKNYKDYDNDQLDFHSYCMRKGTPRAYIDMLHWADKLYDQPLFLRSVKGISEIYLQINHDLATKEDQKTNLFEKYTNLAITKKNKNKNKNKFNKKKEEEINKVTAYDNDQDVYGENLISTTTPIDQLNETFSLLKDKTSVFYTKLAFLIFYHQAKYLLAFQTLKTAKTLISETTLLAYFLIKLTLANNAQVDDPKLAALKKIVSKSVETTFPDFTELNLSGSLVQYAQFVGNGIESNYYFLKALKLVIENDNKDDAAEAEAKFSAELANYGDKIAHVSDGGFEKSLKPNDVVIAKDYVKSKGAEEYYWI